MIINATAAAAFRWYQNALHAHQINITAILIASTSNVCCRRKCSVLLFFVGSRAQSPTVEPTGLEQYITGHAGKGTKWRDIDKTLLHLPPVARPARRICGLHTTLAVREADSKGWFDEEHTAPIVTEASWESPILDTQLMNNFLSDTTTATPPH